MSMQICNFRLFSLLHNNLDASSILAQTFHLRTEFCFALCGPENMSFEVSSKVVFFMHFMSDL